MERVSHYLEVVMPSVRILCAEKVFGLLEEKHLYAIERNLQRAVAKFLSTSANPHEENDIEIIWDVIVRSRNMVDMAVEILFSCDEASDLTADFLAKAHASLLTTLDVAIPPQIRSYSLWIRPQDGAIWDMRKRQ